MNRRQEDGPLRRMVKVAGWLVVVIAVYLGAKLYEDGQYRDEQDRRSVVATQQREQQSQDLACFADNTTKWEVAISDVIVQNVGAPKTPERQEALDNLVKLNRELQQSKSLCPGVSVIPNSPQPVPNVTAGTTTTTAR